MSSLGDPHSWYALALIFPLVLWGVLFSARRSARKQMLFMSLFVMPFGLLQPLYRLDYWAPETLWQWGGFDVESLVYAFCLGGIGSVLFEITSGVEYSVHNRKKEVLFGVYSAGLVFFSCAALWWFGVSSILMSVVVLFLSGGILIYRRPDLRRNALLSGALGLVVTVAVYVVILRLFPEALKRWFATELTVFAIPVWEMLFAFTAGFFFGPLYEFLFGLTARRKI